MNNKLVKKLLKENNMNQNDLSRILKISEAAVSQWNDNNIGIENIYALSRLFNIPIELFLKDNKDDYEYYKLPYTEQFDDVLYNDHEIVDSWSYDLLFNHLQHVTYRFYYLLTKTLNDDLSDEDCDELELLKQYFIYDPKGSIYYEVDVTGDEYTYCNHDEIVPYDDEWVKWDLVKQYKYKYWEKLIDFNNYDDNLGDAHTKMQKYAKLIKLIDAFQLDMIATDAYKKHDWDMLKICLDNGAHIMYMADDFLNLKQLPVCYEKTYTNEEEKTMVYDYYAEIGCGSPTYLYTLLYSEYQECINNEAMEWFRIRCKYKDSDPMKYIAYMEKNYM